MWVSVAIFCPEIGRRYCGIWCFSALGKLLNVSMNSERVTTDGNAWIEYHFVIVIELASRCVLLPVLSAVVFMEWNCIISVDQESHYLISQ